MTFLTFVGLSLAVCFSAFVQGSVGIGFALIMAPILAFVAPSLLPITLLMLMIPLNLLVVYRERKAVDWRGARWVMVGRFFGTFLGIWVLAALSLRQLELAVGLFTVLAAVIALMAPPFNPTRAAGLGAGLFTGVTETATGIAGPPLALLYQHASGPVLRATVALCFLAGEVISLVILAASGAVHAGQITAAACLVPATLAGTVLSRLSHARINGPALRVAVLIFSIASGVILMLKG
ncbi:sulfite exporter TauE/SafE family protein [Paracoccus suum]|uniref:Probable membrane transporter protein n=1 Tax=Paracoccus suum TaxID=2259340 RepID=A0A344PMT7_9RHOB|nr:sulfite exporter TauE/SafE family protein [Paracoccus suum]AXC50692.1 sulfite exporter TauE/SafE family protein [Paracoccus suum]